VLGCEVRAGLVWAQCRAKGGRKRNVEFVVEPSPNVRRVLELTGLTDNVCLSTEADRVDATIEI
jgi:hypothetical protein